jgi:hypothetical protein
MNYQFQKEKEEIKHIFILKTQKNEFKEKKYTCSESNKSHSEHAKAPIFARRFFKAPSISFSPCASPQRYVLDNCSPETTTPQRHIY